MIYYVRWTIAGMLITFAAFVALCQIGAIASLMYRGWRGDEDDRGYSTVPLIGGLLGMVGCIVAPSPSVQRLWWLPLIVDPGCAFLFGVMLVSTVWRSLFNRNGPPT